MSRLEREMNFDQIVVPMTTRDGVEVRARAAENASWPRRAMRAVGNWFWPQGIGNKIIRGISTGSEVAGVGFGIAGAVFAAQGDMATAGVFFTDTALYVGLGIGIEVVTKGAKVIGGRYLANREAAVGDEEDQLTEARTGHGRVTRVRAAAATIDVAGQATTADSDLGAAEEKTRDRRRSIDSEAGMGDGLVHPFSPTTGGVAVNPLGHGSDSKDSEVEAEADVKDARNAVRPAVGPGFVQVRPSETVARRSSDSSIEGLDAVQRVLSDVGLNSRGL